MSTNKDDPQHNSLNELLTELFQRDEKISNHEAMKAIVETIPSIGPLVNYFYDKHIISPSQERMKKFLSVVVLEIYELKQKYISIDPNNNLNLESPKFTTTLMHALQIASRNHQEEKIIALKNSVLNSAFNEDIDDDLQKIYLNIIDNFSAMHFKFLFLIKKAEKKEVFVSDIKNVFPSFPDNEGLYEQVLKDLFSKGLIYSTTSPEEKHNGLQQLSEKYNNSIIANEAAYHIKKGSEREIFDFIQKESKNTEDRVIKRVKNYLIHQFINRNDFKNNIHTLTTYNHSMRDSDPTCSRVHISLKTNEFCKCFINFILKPEFNQSNE